MSEKKKPAAEKSEEAKTNDEESIPVSDEPKKADPVRRRRINRCSLFLNQLK